MRAAIALVLVVAAAGVAAGCRDTSLSITDTDTGADYNKAEVTAAFARYTAAGRTAAAFGALVAELDELRAGMDDAVADEAELKLVTQALMPVEAMRDASPEERRDQLATTVFAFALRPPVTAARPEIPPDPVDRDLRPRAGEDGASYLLRICAGPMSGDCKHIVPEMQAVVVGDIAIQRLTTRSRNAVANCATCPNDPAWDGMVKRWEVLDRDQASKRIGEERRAAPGNWPAAGTAAGAWPDVPSARLEVDGDLILGGRPVPPAERKGELQILFAEKAAIGLELPPAALVSSLLGVIADARAGGVTEVVIAARDPAYPWTLRGYRIAAAARARKVFVRKTDTVQVLLRAIDAEVDPGTRVQID